MSEQSKDLMRDERPGWRRLPIGKTDQTSADRTPMRSLRPIPPAARPSFAPYSATLPELRHGENDLTRLAPGRPLAQGDIITVEGSILNEYGRPFRNTMVEMWGASTFGRYTHKDDPAREPLDPHFLGYGRTITNEDGRYQFKTIRPAAYLARPDIGRWRPAHLHFSLRGGAACMITQMYFPGDPYLDDDPSFQVMGDGAVRHIGKETLFESGAISAALSFDIVIGGPNATMFEEDPHAR